MLFLYLKKKNPVVCSVDAVQLQIQIVNQSYEAFWEQNQQHTGSRRSQRSQIHKADIYNAKPGSRFDFDDDFEAEAEDFCWGFLHSW